MTLEGMKSRRATCSQQSNPRLRMADSRAEQDPEDGVFSSAIVIFRLWLTFSTLCLGGVAGGFGAAEYS